MITKEPLITTAQQIKDILEPIPAELFQRGVYGFSGIGDNSGPEDNGKSSALGHIHRHFNPTDPFAIGDRNGYGTKQLTKKYLTEKHQMSHLDITSVNDGQRVNGYTEPVIKDRILHLINDMIRDGY